MEDKVFILLPVHNRREITEKFIQCLKGQTCRNYHLILIDDGSTDGTEEMVRGRMERLTVIKGKGDWWWAGCLQRGFEWLRGQGLKGAEIVLIMNDDTEFEPDFLERGTSVLKGHPNTLLGAQCYSRSTGKLLDHGVRAYWKKTSFAQADKPEEINCLSTMGLFLRAGDFLRIGGFYPRLLPHFTSDYEFTIRAHRKGFKLMTDPSVRLWLREETTWNLDMGKEPFFSFARILFSKKSPHNPIVWTFFIALACPWRWKVLNWYRLWLGTASHLFFRALRPVTLEGSTHCAGRGEKRP